MMDSLIKKRRLELVICLFLIAASLLVYFQIINYDFINYDDELYLTKNPNIKAGLTPESIIWAFTTGYASNWHPLTWLSHMLDIELYGLNPMGHHWTNLQIHILNTVLLFLFLRWMTGAIWKSAFVAVFFAIHPLHVESVAWIAERKDVLCAFFWILSMLTYVGYVRHPKKRYYLLLVILFALGLMSKPMIVTLPFALLLLDFWPLDRFRLINYEQKINVFRVLKTLIWEKIPLFVLSAISCFITFFVQQHGGAVASIEVFPLNARVANSIVSYTSYIGKMIWPLHLAVLYPLREWHLGQVLISGLLLLFLSILAIRVWRRFPYVTVGWFWFLGTLVPVIGLVQVGAQSIADRYTYIPLVGLFIIIAWGMADISVKWRRQRIVLSIFSGVIVLFFMIYAWFQVGYWKNGITLFTHAIHVTRNNSIAHCELANALYKHGKYIESVKHFKRAIQLNPKFGVAHDNLGVALARMGNLEKAIDQYNQALHIDPENFHAYNNLGNALAQKGDVEEAVHYYQNALHYNPNMEQALFHLATIYACNRKVEVRNGREAVRLAKRLCKITHYEQPLALDTLAAAYAEVGHYDKAIIYIRKALDLTLKNGFGESVSVLKEKLQRYEQGMPCRLNE